MDYIRNCYSLAKNTSPLTRPYTKTLAFWSLSTSSEHCQKQIRLGKHTVLATSVYFAYARVGHAEATDSGWPDEL